jgi:hypothetical protein
MTRDDIIRLALEACDKDKVDPYQNDFWAITQEELERFAALVAAAERERLAMVFDKEEDRPYYGRHVAQKLRKLGAK